MQDLLIKSDEHLTDREFRGGKYDSKRSVKDCAACIRADIKAAVKAGTLPRGKYSVAMRHHRAIVVTIAGVQFIVLNRARVALEAAHPCTYPRDSRLEVYSAMGKALLKRVESMVNAYKRDNSDTQSGYFDVNFYDDVKFDWEWTKEQRAAIIAQEVASPRYSFNVEHGSLINWSKTP